MPVRITLFAMLCVLDMFALVAAVIAVLSLAATGSTGMSEVTVEIFGSTYAYDGPAFPWLVGILAGGSAAAGLLAFRGAQFRFVRFVALAWVAFGVALAVVGAGPGLLAQRLLVLLLLISGRSWFRS